MALFFCAIFEMLILLCEALDTRAAADARLAAAPASREGAERMGRATMPVAGRAFRLALVPDVHAISPQGDATLSGTASPAHGGRLLDWARYPGPTWAVVDFAWRPCRETRVCVPRSSTPISLLKRNEMQLSH